MTRNSQEPLLQMLAITKKFPGVTALDNVDLEIRRGEIHGLVGENGAGKTTLVNILTGMLQPDSGKILLDGKTITGMNPHKAKELGIAIVPQQVLYQPYLTVAENIFAGNWPTRGRLFVDWKKMSEAARSMLLDFDLHLDPHERMERLNVGSRQVIEIVRALHANAYLIVLDEPTPPLTAKEVETLFKYIRSLRDRNITFLYISHYLHEVFELCDRVTVLRDGKQVATCDVDKLTEAELVRLMIGSDVELFPEVTNWQIGNEVLAVKELSTDLLQQISFSIYSGEIVGLFGLAGAGCSELGRAICGLAAKKAGQIVIKGRPATIRVPSQALHTGIAYLPENRREEGLIGVRSVKENVTLASIANITNNLGFIQSSREKEITAHYIHALDINTPTMDQEVQYLSGGNQQKVVLAKLLATQAKVLVLNEPTQGIDVGAKAEIHRLMRKLASEGTAMILISSDLSELLAMCHRILVLRDGQIVAHIPRNEATKSKLLLYAGGAATKENERSNS